MDRALSLMMIALPHKHERNTHTHAHGELHCYTVNNTVNTHTQKKAKYILQ